MTIFNLIDLLPDEDEDGPRVGAEEVAAETAEEVVEEEIVEASEEVAEEPGFEGFTVPIDKEGANLLTTIHNKLVNTHTDDLKHWWKIFYAAKEDWTVPSDAWEGTNWGLFTGDDEAMKTMVGRIVDHMESLQIKNLLWPE